MRMQSTRSEANSLPHLSRVQNYRRNLTPDQQQQLLARRREIYRAKHGPPKFLRKQTLDLEKRKESVKRACAAFRARQKAKKQNEQHQTL